VTYLPPNKRQSRGYGAILLRWLWLILLLMVVTVGVIYLRASAAPPEYQATVTLQVIAQEPEEVSLYTTLRSAATEELMRSVRAEFVGVLGSTTIAWQSPCRRASGRRETRHNTCG